MLAIFLGGLSLHVSQALLSHMFEINMTWVSLSFLLLINLSSSSSETCEIQKLLLHID